MNVPADQRFCPIPDESSDDVGTDHPFHDEVSLSADAGITTGFPDGGYHPGDPVTRQAMAAFLGRNFARVGYDTNEVTTTTTGDSQTIATIHMARGDIPFGPDGSQTQP